MTSKPLWGYVAGGLFAVQALNTAVTSPYSLGIDAFAALVYLVIAASFLQSSIRLSLVARKGEETLEAHG